MPPVGLGGEARHATMMYLPRGGASSEKIEIRTLDDEREQARLPRPDFMKVDTEGFELEVLQGGRATLAECRPELLLEMHGATMAEKHRKTAARGHLYCRWG